MSIVGIGEAEREAVLRTVAAVLHLGNITFASAPDEGSALSSRSAKEALAACADLLQVRACYLRRPEQPLSDTMPELQGLSVLVERVS